MSNCFGEFLLLPHQRSYPSLAHSVVTQCDTVLCCLLCQTVLLWHQRSYPSLSCLVTQIYSCCRGGSGKKNTNIKAGSIQTEPCELHPWRLFKTDHFSILQFSTDGGKEKKEKNIAVNIMLIKSFKKAMRIIAMMIIVTMMMIIVMATLMMMTIRLDGERGSKGEK